MTPDEVMETLKLLAGVYWQHITVKEDWHDMVPGSLPGQDIEKWGYSPGDPLLHCPTCGDTFLWNEDRIDKPGRGRFFRRKQ